MNRWHRLEGKKAKTNQASKQRKEMERQRVEKLIQLFLVTYELNIYFQWCNSTNFDNT